MFERISIFYHVVLKISRLKNRILVIYAIYKAGLFSQKEHDVQFSDSQLFVIYCNTRLFMFHGIFVT